MGSPPRFFIARMERTSSIMHRIWGITFRGLDLPFSLGGEVKPLLCWVSTWIRPIRPRCDSSSLILITLGPPNYPPSSADAVVFGLRLLTFSWPTHSTTFACHNFHRWYLPAPHHRNKMNPCKRAAPSWFELLLPNLFLVQIHYDQALWSSLLPFRACLIVPSTWLAEVLPTECRKAFAWEWNIATSEEKRSIQPR